MAGADRRTSVQLTYEGIEDPDVAEMERVMGAVGSLGGAPARVVMPGVVATDFGPGKVDELARKLPGWRVSREGRLSAPPPHKTRFKPRER